MSEKFFPGNNENKESPARELLLNLEKTGKYVFHGSNEKIEGELEPRQATVDGKNHGDPGISATSYAEIAIFRAVVNKKNFPDNYGTRFGVSKANEKQLPEYEVTESISQALKTSGVQGYVYVLKKEDFTPYGDSKWEVRTNIISNPLYVIEVTAKDLPKNIKSM